MPKPTPRFEIRQNAANQHYWVLIAKNGEVVAVSEAYDSKSNCRRGIKDALDAASSAGDNILDTTR